MKILVIGDSNFRDLFTSHGEDIGKNTGAEVNFEYATSNMSTKMTLDGVDSNTDVVFIASPTNEISMKSKNNTNSREGIIETVLTELYETINIFAQKNERLMVVVCFPWIRQDPPWLEGKLNFYKDCLRKVHNQSCQQNIHLGSEIEITAEHLKPDKVHLNKDGLKFLNDHLIKDVKIAEKELTTRHEEETDDTMESLDTQTEFITPPSKPTRSLRKTPARNKRQIEESGGEEVKTKKKKTGDSKIDTVLDKLDLFMRELREDRKSNDQKFEKIEASIKETKLDQEDIKKEIKKIKEDDSCFAASVREDIDAMDNLNARDTVVIKRMATERDVPTDKKELTAFIMAVGKDVLTKVMGSDKGMKFIAPLFTRNERRVIRDGEVPRKELPPFKIVFKLLSDAVEFKEKAIAASKDPTHKLYKSYISSQQNVGTRIRLQLMWGVVDHFKKEKKEAWVSQSSPKPCLMVKQAGNMVKTYSFIETMMTYGDKIEEKVLNEATKLAHRFYYGQVEKVFIVLKD
jgi:hypothetical protein